MISVIRNLKRRKYVKAKCRTNTKTTLKKYFARSKIPPNPILAKTVVIKQKTPIGATDINIRTSFIMTLRKKFMIIKLVRA